MSWLLLLIAGLFECAWVIALKHSSGFTKTVPGVLTVLFMAISMYLLALSMKQIPMGTAYGVWTGIGTAGVVIAGMLWFGESKDVLRIFFLLMIVLGVFGLRISSR
ncbi:MAG: multidrug efflux SMR transporter [Chlorobiaceae bacterium]|nr:multidrug efflux SMR transporter [Chlorobiaceae bacterium]